MKRRNLVLLVLTLVAGLIAAGAWLRYPIWRAQRLVADQMFDPGSATFREVRVADGAVCGLVNAKNRYGAYVGYTMFAVEHGGRVLIAPTTEPDTSQTGTVWEEYARMKELEERLALLEQIIGYCKSPNLDRSTRPAVKPS